MKKLEAFIRGALEFRACITAHYDDLALLDAYDTGREWAHRITFRRFES